jgi:hypothetical protein
MGVFFEKNRQLFELRQPLRRRGRTSHHFANHLLHRFNLRLHALQRNANGGEGQLKVMSDK